MANCAQVPMLKKKIGPLNFISFQKHSFFCLRTSKRIFPQKKCLIIHISFSILCIREKVTTYF